MQVRPADHMPRRPDIADDFSLGDLLAGRQTLRILGEVTIEEEILAAGVLLIDGLTALALAGDAHDLAIRRREDRSSAGRPDVDRQVLSAAPTPREERV